MMMNPLKHVAACAARQINRSTSLQVRRNSNYRTLQLLSLLCFLMFSGILSAQSNYFYRLEGSISPINSYRNKSKIKLESCKAEWNKYGKVDTDKIVDVFLDYNIKEYMIELDLEKVYITSSGRERSQVVSFKNLEVYSGSSKRLRVTRESSRAFKVQLRDIDLRDYVPLKLKLTSDRKSIQVDFLVYVEQMGLEYGSPVAYSKSVKNYYNDSYGSRYYSKSQEKPASKYLVQIATLKNYPSSYKFESLSSHGNVLVRRAENKYKVFLGSYTSKAQAEEVLTSIRRNGHRGFLVTEGRGFDDYELVLEYNYLTEKSGRQYIPQEFDNTFRSYSVRRGDTLYSIAQDFGMTVNELKRVNNLRGNTIRVNQVLEVR